LLQIPFNNRFVALGEPFYEKTAPDPVARPALIKFNDALAEALGIAAGDRDADELAAVFAGNVIPAGAEPLAMAYAGHQFGSYTPQLGDGRAILLGEVCDAKGNRFDIQLKGAGRTVYSRSGDGRSALGPVLREYLVSEAMAAIGVPTTRALAAVATGEDVMRERPQPGAVMTRVARSFVRVGTFQYFAAQGEHEAVRTLADHVIARNYPELVDAANPYAALLQAVVDGQAALIARWMQLGFIHGVMNTDNMSIAGETIDYGPCAFMDAYAHDRVFSSIDFQGRYAYHNQPTIGLWNLTRLAECLLPLLAPLPTRDIDAAVEAAQAILTGYRTAYQAHWLAGMRAKLGLSGECEGATDAEDAALIEALFEAMAAGAADFTLTFYHLSRLDSEPSERDDALRGLFADTAPLDDWLATWRTRLGFGQASDAERQAAMQAVNPVYIPRNHQIEAAIRAAEDDGDYSVFHALHDVLQQPYVEQPGKERYMLPPEPHEVVTQTFCGT